MRNWEYVFLKQSGAINVSQKQMYIKKQAQYQFFLILDFLLILDFFQRSQKTRGGGGRGGGGWGGVGGGVVCGEGGG